MKFFGKITLFSIASFLLSSCNSNEESSMKINNTVSDRATALVTSTEFNSMSENANNFGLEIRANYLKLSTSEQNLFTKTIEQVKSSQNLNDAQNLINIASSIIKIDILNRINLLYQQSVKLTKIESFKSIDKKEVIIALTRSSLVKRNSGNVRYNALSPRAACLATFTVGLGACAFTGPGYEICALVVAANYIICINSIQQE